MRGVCGANVLGLLLTNVITETGKSVFVDSVSQVIILILEAL